MIFIYLCGDVDVCAGDILWDGEERKGREGNGTERKGMEGNGTEGNGRERTIKLVYKNVYEGNGRERKGRERKGTEGNGREFFAPTWQLELHFSRRPGSWSCTLSFLASLGTARLVLHDARQFFVECGELATMCILHLKVPNSAGKRSLVHLMLA
jgi:hypothetical protein